MPSCFGFWLPKLGLGVNENEELNFGFPNIWNCIFVPLPTLTGVCSKRHKLGYKFMDKLFGKLGEGGKGNHIVNSDYNFLP